MELAQAYAELGACSPAIRSLLAGRARATVSRVKPDNANSLVRRGTDRLQASAAKRILPPLRPPPLRLSRCVALHRRSRSHRRAFAHRPWHPWRPAWKTGTSSGHRDAWCAAVTPSRTVVVWLGNLDGSGSDRLVGADAAAAARPAASSSQRTTAPPSGSPRFAPPPAFAAAPAPRLGRAFRRPGRPIDSPLPHAESRDHRRPLHPPRPPASRPPAPAPPPLPCRLSCRFARNHLLVHRRQEHRPQRRRPAILVAPHSRHA